MTVEPTMLLRTLLDSALKAASPELCVPPALPARPKGRTIVIGAGKASAAMAAAVERVWEGPLEGIVVTRYGHAVPCDRVEIVEAAHPVPDAAGQRAAERILSLVSGLGPDDLVICLISGGGSALLALPATGLTLDDKQAVSRSLLRSGATISEMNCVRRHLSAIKGGRLACASAPAALHTIMISDVPGDDPTVIASGPTVPDPTSVADALDILARYQIDGPPAVIEHLRRGHDETPKPGDPAFANARAVMAATPRMALQAAAESARAAGVVPVILSDRIEGEARDVALVHAAIARNVQGFGEPVRPPCVLLSGGETTVTVRGQGRGGRNTEFMAALLDDLRGLERVWGMACDTDGIDGTEDNAGALMTPDTYRRAEAAGLLVRAYLEDNNGYDFFAAVNGLIVTGPTHTNVNDFRALLILPS